MRNGCGRSGLQLSMWRCRQDRPCHYLIISASMPAHAWVFILKDNDNMGRFTGTVAMVTGAGSGIGLATAERFAHEGAAVVLTDINAEQVKKETLRLSNEGFSVHAIVHDVTSEDAWDRAMTEAVGWHGKIDVLVNNAGIGVMGTVEDTSLEDWRKTMAVNLDGVFLGTQKAIKVMKVQGGSIINVSSIEGIIGEPLIAAYNASKGGVRIFTKSAALHCMSQGYPVRINSIHPGFVVTPMVSGFLSQVTAEVGEAFQQDLIKRIPMGRLAQPGEIAGAILFLASEDASYMTGSELVVDGGYTAR